MPIAIITDSASNLSKDLLEKYNIDMVVLSYSIDDVSRPCYDPLIPYDEHGKEFYDNLKEGKIVKTSLPSPQQFYEVFKKHLDNGEDIIYVGLTLAISGTINSAMNAKLMLEEEYPDRKIRIVDAWNASFAEGLVAIRARELTNTKSDIDEIVKILEIERTLYRSEVTVDSLKYLKRGGRVTSFKFIVGTLLHIKPMLTATPLPSLDVCGVQRGRNNAIKKLVHTVAKTIVGPENQTLYIAHCDCIEDVNRIKKMLMEEIPGLTKFYVSMWDFCTGAHVGPGTVACFFKGTDRMLDK